MIAITKFVISVGYMAPIDDQMFKPAGKDPALAQQRVSLSDEHRWRDDRYKEKLLIKFFGLPYSRLYSNIYYKLVKIQ